jgi:tetratricopeptide (TPR) repeat protein
VLAALLAYANSFSGALTFDDHATISGNESIRHLWPPGAALHPPADGPTGGRPLANLTFALSYALSGAEPWGHHALNFLTHALAALALFGLVRRTLAGPALRGRFGAEALPLAAFVALLWAVHPLSTSTVTYLSQRTESLMALCYLLTLYGFVRGLDGPPLRWHALAAVACLAGTWCKESIATAPLVALLYDRGFVAGGFGAALRARWRTYAALAASWGVLAFNLAEVSERKVGFGLGVPVHDYVLTSCQAVTRYLALGAWPHPMVFDYGPVFLRSPETAAPYLLVVAVLLAAAVWLLVRRHAAGFAGAAFLLILAPTSSFVPVALQPIAENRAYLPLAALVALGVVGGHALLGWRRGRVVWLAAAVALTAGAMLRNRTYGSARSLWADTVAKAPANPRAHNNLALHLAADPAARTAAIAHYKAALSLKPDYAEAHHNFALLLATDPARRAEAEQHYESALAAHPDYAEAYHHLALLLAQDPARRATALSHLETALHLRPDHAEAHHSLAVHLATDPARGADALRHAREAVRLRPGFAEAHNQLALLLARPGGDTASAVTHFQTALRLRPDYIEAAANLALTLAAQPDRAEEAALQLSAALRRTPGNADAHNTLGSILAHRLDRPAEARTQFETALRLRPDFAAAHYNLAGVLATSPQSTADALRHYDAAIKANPDYAEAYNNRGLVLARDPATTAEALAHYETAIRLKPDYFEAHNNLAILLGKSPDRHAAAVARFREALRLRPDSTTIHYNLARELAKSPAELAEAIALLRAALALAPDFAAARTELERLEREAR